MVQTESLISALENIYISPLEQCNLNCKYCYTHKTKNVLSNKQILNFVRVYGSFLKSYSRKFLTISQLGNGLDGGQKFCGKTENSPRYNKYISNSFNTSAFDGLQRQNIDQPQKHLTQKNTLSLKSILFCGGEVFLLPDFPPLVNQLISQGIFITIITNGTIDRLSEIKDPTNCQLLVSLDGPEKIHDKNRGLGNFQKSKKLIRNALKLGFPVEIMFLINSASYPHRDSFNLFDLPKTYLTDRLHSLTPDQTLNIKKNYPTYPAKNFGCFQLALQSDTYIYGCCESSKPLARMSDPPSRIIDNFINALKPCSLCSNKQCLGCVDPRYLCSYNSELSQQNCQNVVKSFTQ